MLAVEAVVVVVPRRNDFVVGVVVLAVLWVEVVPHVCGLCHDVAALGRIRCAVMDACTVYDPPSRAGEARVERRLFKWYS